MQKLKLYEVQFGWAGCAAVVAHSEEEARQYFKNMHYYYEDDSEVFVHDIASGVSVVNLGDA